MNKRYLIKEDGITIGSFQDEQARDHAFDSFILCAGRFGVKCNE